MSFTDPDRDTARTAAPYRNETPSSLPPPAYMPPATSLGSPATVGAAPQQHRTHAHHRLRETKPSFLTTEFWAMIAAIVALIVLYNVTENPDMTLWRTCLLTTILAAAYIVSRGWAKSGSHADHVDEDSTRYG